ncbi:MAG: peptidoglycan-binding protein [Clostridiales bacterium]|jgi:peptidoglycan hydrolase-like protein with peptidoglycan-binding domain|nr:peptidoglycan-binding protein [Clostridiales bacterium]
MGTGFLQISVTAGTDQTIPIPRAAVTITQAANTLYRLTADGSGLTETVAISAPDKALTLDPAYTGEPYARVNVTAVAAGYATKVLYDVKVLDTITSLLKISMRPVPADDITDDTLPLTNRANQNGNIDEVDLGAHQLVEAAPRENQEYAELPPSQQRVLQDVIIPEYITVHLGAPQTYATNVTVPFVDYIKNVCSNEIYATWPEAAIRANMYCQISLALNRVYTEWYPSKGYNFDITNNTGYDQYYVYGSNIYANINRIGDELFNNYVRRAGHQEPFYTEYCDGIQAQCPGLKQWGTVTLAEEGYAPLDILKYYYPPDIEIVESNNIQGITASYPGYVLKEGASGESVKMLQDELNRIRVNFPAIPQITNPNGYYGPETTAAVKAFQSISSMNLPTANGQVDKATWYKISYTYAAVKKLAELGGEGEIIGITRTPPTSTIRQGSTGTDVGRLQYVLNYIAEFYPEVPSVIQDFSYTNATTNAVLAFQKAFGLPQDGNVGPATWQKLYEVYWEIRDTINVPDEELPAYPGYALTVGASGDAVRQMQNCLNNISASRYPSIGTLTADGSFGPATRSAVMEFQRIYGLTQDGVVGPSTWQMIMQECAYSGGPSVDYPGQSLRSGSSGDAVLQIQKCLNNIADNYPAIPKLTEDGKFGPGTTRSVVAFQQIFGLSADGIVGRQTWDKIIAECHANGTAPAPAYPGYLIGVGSSGSYVLQLQQCLNHIAIRYPSIPRISEDGAFGNGTRTAVIAFQQAFGLTADGLVGQTTWNKIMAQCAAGGGILSSAIHSGKADSRRAPNQTTPANDVMTFLMMNRFMNRSTRRY